MITESTYFKEERYTVYNYFINYFNKDKDVICVPVYKTFRSEEFTEVSRN